MLHAVEVRASSLFEAAVRGLAIIREHPRLAAVLDRATVLEVITIPGALRRVPHPCRASGWAGVSPLWAVSDRD